MHSEYHTMQTVQPRAQQLYSFFRSRFQFAANSKSVLNDKKMDKALIAQNKQQSTHFFCIFRFNGFERTSSATFWIISRKTERARVIPTYVFEQFL